MSGSSGCRKKEVIMIDIIRIQELLYERKTFWKENDCLDRCHIFEEKYEDDITLEGAIHLAITAINEATDHDTTSNNVEIAVIKKDDGKYVKLSSEEVQNYIDEILVVEEEEEESEEEVEESQEDEE